MSAESSKNGQNLLFPIVEQLLGDRVLSAAPLHGGDLSKVVRLRLASGKHVVMKSGPHPDREARMLRSLADNGAHVPLPIASNSDVLVLEDLGPAGSPDNRTWRALGAHLRAVHAVPGDRFGWDDDYAFGKVRIHNCWRDNWPEFWIEQRLLVDRDALPIDIAHRIEELRMRLVEVLPSTPRPALLHGDLWSGNVYFTASGGACLIDPASYYGHAEVDLAMLTLFGSPPAAFWEAYGPLEDGWQLRRHAYQLWPALVHLRLFGAGYRSLVDRLIAALEE